MNVFPLPYIQFSGCLLFREGCSLAVKGGEIIQLPRRYWRAERAFAYGSRRNIVGLEFGQFGKKVGWSLIRKRHLRGINWVLVPVNITRYFEFSFVQANMSSSAINCLDVSSPALYSLYRTYHEADVTVHMINPDIDDIETTVATARVLGLTNLYADNLAIDQLSAPTGGYDCIWSISVVEHIAGDYDDREGMRMLYDLLASGGRLIVTIPVDRSYWIEYRDNDYYSTQFKQGGKYFFQRFYDRDAIRERLLEPIGREPTVVRWFGERINGRFQNYIQRWLKEGVDCTLEDPREIADYYEQFDSWQMMPGVGVCGLVIDKP
jgi:hypothetical protein